MKEELKTQIDERLLFKEKDPDWLHIEKHVHKLKAPTFSVRLPIYQNDVRKSKYIGRYNSLAEAVEARDYALEQIETSSVMSMTKGGN